MLVKETIQTATVSTSETTIFDATVKGGKTAWVTVANTGGSQALSAMTFYVKTHKDADFVAVATNTTALIPYISAGIANLAAAGSGILKIVVSAMYEIRITAAVGANTTTTSVSYRCVD